MLHYFLALAMPDPGDDTAIERAAPMEPSADFLQVSLETAKKPTIARIWRGRVKRERADEYQAYNYEFGIKPLVEKALGVQAMRDDGESESEFITISYWENVEAMSRFTGGDPNQIHHLPRDAEFLTVLPRSVQILNIYLSLGRIQ